MTSLTSRASQGWNQSFEFGPVTAQEALTCCPPTAGEGGRGGGGREGTSEARVGDPLVSRLDLEGRGKTRESGPPHSRP